MSSWRRFLPTRNIGDDLHDENKLYGKNISGASTTAKKAESVPRSSYIAKGRPSFSPRCRRKR